MVSARIHIVQRFLSVFLLVAGLFHVHRSRVLFKAQPSASKLPSIKAYTESKPYMEKPLLRRMKNDVTNKNPPSISFGERKRARIQSQGGIRSKHEAHDRAWIDSISSEIGCPDVDSDGIHSDDPKGYTNIPTVESWNALYRAYHATVDPNSELMSATEYQNSWKVPIEVKFRLPEGRGVYAKEFIPKGTLVWSSTTRNTATFLSHHDRREFIKYLMKDPETRHLACDVRKWVDYIRSSNGSYYICETFDEAVLLNNVRDESDGTINLEPQSISLSTDHPDYDENDCYGNDHFFTIRDIQAGEQLRIEY
ncbi:SET methyltransferase domain containing protein [Nitzschia inconspicua]|uniref:SET methyltransferase domain containing protein n=1 Tax=Nitzschia inconspicua TaxID=303405 RepID=A0A9K3KC51_9STRA|nr:SET methyltransferase domain containing protein [Nitzschia inconspicua]